MYFQSHLLYLLLVVYTYFNGGGSVHISLRARPRIVLLYRSGFQKVFCGRSILASGLLWKENDTAAVVAILLPAVRGLFTLRLSLFAAYSWRVSQYCCAALCLVAQDVCNCVLIINEGAIPHMLAGTKDGDMVTKQSCCAVLSTLSSKVGGIFQLFKVFVVQEAEKRSVVQAGASGGGVG